jgi:hypothetical protein
VDDELKRRIAGSLDLPADGPADPVVVRALADDPAAARYALELRALEGALRRWPSPALAPEALDGLLNRVEQALDGLAKVRRAEPVSRQDGGEPAAVPQFDDEPSIPTESIQTMSERNEPEASTPSNDVDSDLEGLAALARTSLGPRAMEPLGASVSLRASVPGPALTDGVDETSSGIVDIKHLAQLARGSVSVPPATVPSEPAKVESKAEPAAASSASAPTPAARTVTPSPTASPAAPAVISPKLEPVPPRRNGALWGALGGIAASALAFLFWTQSQDSREAMNNATAPLESPSPAAPSASAPAVAPGAPGAPGAPASTAARQGLAEAPAASTPTATLGGGAPGADPAQAPPPAVLAAPAAAPSTPAAPAPAAAVATESVAGLVGRPEAPADPALRTSDDRRSRRGREANGAPAAQRDQGEVERAPAAPPPAPTPAPAPPAAPARTVAPATPTPAAAPPSQPAARSQATNSIADLLNQAAPTPRAGGPTLPAAPAPQAQAPSGDVPERPTRQMVTSVLTPLNGAVRACAQGQTGTAPVAITIADDGSVRSADVRGQFGGTPVGACIEGVVRRARFQPFRAPQANVTWPFVILPPR